MKKYSGKILVKDTRRPTFFEKPKFPKNIIGAAEMWVLENIKMTDPLSERVIRFCTYNDDTDWNFEYDVPRYAFDDACDVYDEFCEVSEHIGQFMLALWSNIRGNYYYDVRVSISYSNPEYKDDYLIYFIKYNWEILETDHPRILCSNAHTRRDCHWMRVPFRYSRLSIEGYDINGQYRRFVDLLCELSNKTILVHSQSDVKALMRVFRYLGVKHLKKNDRFYVNNPYKRAFFSKFTPAYRLERIEGDWVLVALSLFDVPSNTEQVLDIDELIVYRSLKARLRDLRPITN